MHLMVAAVLCMTQMVETTTALKHQDDHNHSKFPQEVVNNIARFLKPGSRQEGRRLAFLIRSRKENSSTMHQSPEIRYGQQ